MRLPKLILLLLGLLALTSSPPGAEARAHADIRQLQNIRFEQSAREVVEQLGAPTRKTPEGWLFRFREGIAKLVFRDGTLVAGQMQFDRSIPAEECLDPLTRLERIEPRGKRQLDTAPTGGLFGAPAWGTKWRINIRGRITAWYLSTPWPSSEDLLSVNESIKSLQEPHRR